MSKKPNKCPFCGAEIERTDSVKTPTTSGRLIEFTCDTMIYQPDEGEFKTKGPRGDECINRQIAQLKARNKKLEKVAAAGKEFEKVLSRKLIIHTRMPTRSINDLPTLMNFRDALAALEEG